MQVNEIVRKAGMSARPGAYSGRGATLSDLDSQKLEKIHDGIRVYFGQDAAKGFVDMVAGMEVLSATDFLLELQRLELNDWKWEAPAQPGSGIYADSPGAALGTIGSVLSRDDRDDTDQIRWSFLREHKPEALEGRSLYKTGSYYYGDEEDDTDDADLRDQENEALEDDANQGYSNPYRRW